MVGGAAMTETVGCRWIRREVFSARVLPWVLLVLLTIVVVRIQGQQQESVTRHLATDAANGRETLCAYANRIADGARLDRQFLVVLSERPGQPIAPDHDALVAAYLHFGDLAFPHLDCKKVVLGDPPPPLPPLPPSPLTSTPAD
jgi:hypothetical protein